MATTTDTGPSENETTEEEAVLKHVSLNVTELLCAIGFSKKEVTVRQFKWHLLERTDALMRQFGSEEKGYVHSGSSSEGMTGGPYYNGEPSDFDTMEILANVRVVENEQDIQTVTDYNSGRCTYVRELPDPEFPGYVKLAVVKDQRKILGILPIKDDLYYFPNSLVTSETAVKQKLESVYKHPNPGFRHHQLSDSELHGPAISFKAAEPEDTVSKIKSILEQSPDRSGRRQRGSQCDIDMVGCIKSIKWPESADNWASRCRQGNWPEQDVIEKLQKTTVYLAPVGHKNSPDIYLQWRPSFNVAEKILIRSFNLTQINCYALLKIYLKDHLKKIVPDVLSSYCMKTAVFWMSEKLGREKLIPENLLVVFVECLQALKQWLQEGKVPHYFIQSRNALGTGITETDFLQAIRELDTAIQDPVAAIQSLESFERAIDASEGDPTNFPKLIQRSFLMAWLEMRCGILERIHFWGTHDLLWKPIKDDDLNETICRYKVIIADLQLLEYGDPFVQLAQSALGFLLYAKGLKEKENSSNNFKDSEELLLSGINGDCTLCPLKLATYYLGQNKPENAYKIANRVMENSDLISRRHSFIDVVYKVVHEQYTKIANTIDPDTLATMFNLVIVNAREKTYEQLLYSRKDCEAAKCLLNAPVAAMKLLAFDVTFLLPEYPALPRAIQLEVNFSRENEVLGHAQCVKLSPLVYAQYCKFLASKALSNYQKYRDILQEFHAIVEQEHGFYKSRGYNLLAACYEMLNITQEAARCRVSSLKQDPTWHNVSYGYFAVVVDTLLELVNTRADCKFQE